jgi:MFS family permease
MYGLVRESLQGITGPGGGLRLGLRGVGRAVIFLGLTSLFTDISSEMVSTVLPVYLIFHLQASPLQFGIIDGLYQGASAPLRIVAGLAADRLRRLKEVAFLGYAISAASRIALPAAGSALGLVGGVILVDRLGKGVRTAPRDALISLNAEPDRLGLAFGVHRALDTGGALLGPLVAFAILTAAPGAFDAIFVVSFCFAVVGLGVIGLLVESRRGAWQTAGSLAAVVRLVRIPGLWALLLAAGMISLFTISDAFVYLALQRRLHFALSWFPLLYVGTSVAYLVLAVPVGRLADRAGRANVFLGAQLVLAGVYALALAGPGWAAAVLVMALLGTFYAASDGVLAAAASALLPEEVRTSGLALFSTVTSGARLGASVGIGAVWSLAGPEAAFATFGAGLLLATAAGAVGMARTRHG